MAKTGLKKKYNIVLSRETNIARLIALKVLKPKPFTVWEVLIPILFIFGYMKSKEQREIFAQNLLFTKKLALDAAYDMLKNKHSRESAELQIKKKTDDLLAALPEDVYSDTIRQEQLREVDLLMVHYCKLMQAEGRDYDALVLDAYRTRAEYSSFLEGLRGAEGRVSQAARRTLGANTDTAMVERIETATSSARMAEIDKIFDTNSQS